MDISVKPPMPDLLEDYLFFFDNLVFTENPDWTRHRIKINLTRFF
jgi:hypothetical protein